MPMFASSIAGEDMKKDKKKKDKKDKKKSRISTCMWLMNMRD